MQGDVSQKIVGYRYPRTFVLPGSWLAATSWRSNRKEEGEMTFWSLLLSHLSLCSFLSCLRNPYSLKEFPGLKKQDCRVKERTYALWEPSEVSTGIEKPVIYYLTTAAYVL